MKVYKGTDKNMVCNPGGDNPFRYEQGVTYEKPKAELCSHGFHACEAPLDVLTYYAPGAGSRYFEAELEDVSAERGGDSKVCGKKITLGAEIGIPGLVTAHFEYVKSKCEEEKNGGYRSALNGGYGSALNGGDRSVMRGGFGSKFKGGMWAVFAAEILGKEGNIIGVKSGVVDGETLKPDTWYTLKDGEFVEVDD